MTVTDLCLLPGILGVDICGECDAAGTGNSALNDYANARLWEFFGMQLKMRLQEETDEK